MLGLAFSRATRTAPPAGKHAGRFNGNGGRVASVRIALISDDRLFSDGIVTLLQTYASFEVVDQPELAAVLLIDSHMDNALDLCSAARGRAGALLLAAPADTTWCRDALCAGASGVLPKNAGADELVAAITAIAAGSVWAPRRVMAECIQHLLSGSVARRAGGAVLEQHLSRREREIFRQAATGLANKELASRFDIGEATVKAHLTSIFQKLGVRGRAELAAVYHGGQPARASAPPVALPATRPPVVRQRSNSPTHSLAKK
jgi:DNA-binding NarL/FixJ family response regulator